MLPVLRWVVVVSAFLVPPAASAQRGLVIAGGVYDDRGAQAMTSNFVPLVGVSVVLYRDTGDRVPDDSDVLVAKVLTDAEGLYVFAVDRPGDFWVVVDSKTIAREQGAWPEQTFGPAGALCAQPEGAWRTNWFAGACFGGRTAGSDEASRLETSEHVALVSVPESATNVDFGFSFDVVTSVMDGEAVQGSLRQFIMNANAIAGANSMRFVPLDRAPERRDTTFGVPPRWWAIELTVPLPPLDDEDTTIDGTVFNFLSPVSVMNVHPGRIGEPATIRPDDQGVPRLEKPELEITLAGEEGIVCMRRCGIRAVAVQARGTAIVARGDLRMEHVLIGASPDGVPASYGGQVGLEISGGTTLARHLLITGQSRVGLIAGPEARLDGERLDISRCGTLEAGAAIVLLSDGSSIRSSAITANSGAGIILGSLDGKAPAHANTIDGSLISGNQAGVILAPGAMRNVITRNDIMWNRLGGVTISPFEGSPPRENRLSANRYNENGLRPIVLNLAAEEPDELARPADTCDRSTSVPASGILPPRLTSVRVVRTEDQASVIIHGRACPGEIVELYQSFVTSGVREKAAELPRIRAGQTRGETIVSQERLLGLPSIGEFNYLGATHAREDGTFEASYPIPVIVRSDDSSRQLEETRVWASEVLRSGDTSTRAYSGIAIDPSGNTSEMGVRRRVD